MYFVDEEYVSIETAKLLMACGYPFKREEVLIPRPSLAQAMKFLREDKKLFVEISCLRRSRTKYTTFYCAVIVSLEKGENYLKGRAYRSGDTYEQTAEEAIRLACKRLLHITP